MHLTVDVVAALVLGALEGEAREKAEAHLASGCARCLRERAWVEQTMAMARADRSVAPPPLVLTRAIRIMAAARPAEPTRSFWRRLRARPILDSMGGLAAPDLAGARGSSTARRQVHYGVQELNLEIDVQVRRMPEAPAVLDLRGQVFSLDDDVQSVAGLPVVVDAAEGTRQASTSSLGDFHLEVPDQAEHLVVQVRGCAVEVAIPRP